MSHYEVLRDAEPVLRFTPGAGHLWSTAPRAAGQQPPAHPFVDARALDASHEQELAQVLEASSSVDDFVTRLGHAGFAVRLLDDGPLLPGEAK